MPKRKRSRHKEIATKQSDAIPHLPRPKCAPASIGFNELCSVCKTTFSRVRKSRVTFSWFHSVIELNESAANGCHFCKIVVDSMHREGRSTTNLDTTLLSENDRPVEANTKRLRSETRYYTDLGVSCILRQDGAASYDYLGIIDMRFEDDAGRSRSLLLLSMAYLTTALDEIINFTESVHTQSKISWNQVLKWIQQCSTSHATCQQKSAIVPKKEWPPG